jgi:membrane-bound lytic murein transglycosylase C
MGNPKIIKLLCITFVFLTSANAQTYQEFLKSNQSSFEQYQNDINKEFKQYQEAYQKSFQQFTKELDTIWPNKNGKQDITSKHKFVEYSKDLKEKKIIDYQKEQIELEVVSDSKQEARRKINKMFNDILNEDVKTAYKNDLLESKIAKKLNKKRITPKTNKKLIADIINRQQKQDLIKKLKTTPIKVIKYNGKYIYKVNVKLPSNSIIKKAKIYKTKVYKEARVESIPPELIYAIIHSESSYNPMARSAIPAFGLMQIVPRTAGVDSYRYLYNKKRVLSSSYLYDSNNNIKIGSAYLHILYYRYLRKIKDPNSRLYCTIAAYNTGAGNVAKVFIGNTNISKASRKINMLNSDQVYKKLMKKLPYNETKKYLYKVSNRVAMYKKMLTKDNL